MRIASQRPAPLLGWQQRHLAYFLGLAERDVMNSNTERVIRIAAAWSLDPSRLDERDGQAGRGCVGRR